MRRRVRRSEAGQTLFAVIKNNNKKETAGASGGRSALSIARKRRGERKTVTPTTPAAMQIAPAPEAENKKQSPSGESCVREADEKHVAIRRKNCGGAPFSPSAMMVKIALTLTGLVLRQVCALEAEDSLQHHHQTVNKPVIGSSSEQPPWVRFSPEYVRCFCNLPACVSTGYMCKSSGGGCFSDLLDLQAPSAAVSAFSSSSSSSSASSSSSMIASSSSSSASQGASPFSSATYRGRHGCLELLTDKDQRSWCQNNPETNTKLTLRRKNHPRSLLLCCYHDMCNHADSPETKNLIKNSSQGVAISDGDQRFIENLIQQQESAGYSTADVWFKAATIAVPICGAVILFVLIALAIRILRTESLTPSDHKLAGSAYYMQPITSRSKNCDKTQEHYENGLLNELLTAHQHQNCLYSNHNEEMQRQIHVPLLQNHCESKNETNAKLNLLNQSGSDSYDAQIVIVRRDEPSLEKECSESNLCKNVNIISKVVYSDSHVCGDKIYPKHNMLM